MTKSDLRPIGPAIETPPLGLKPDRRVLFGRWTQLEPVSVSRHGEDLFDSFNGKDPEGHVWTYMGYGPFTDRETFLAWLAEKEAARDPWFYVFIPRDTKRAMGMGAFLRCDAGNGVIEIGHIWMAPALQRTRASTDAIYLMMRHAFEDLQVRRLEWKCDALNAPSRRAAERFGFAFEGVFRQHMIYKRRNRDTAWYAMIDQEWHAASAAFRAWLADANFDDAGHQRKALSAFMPRRA